MLLVDPRTGSADYAPLLRALGAECELATLDFADIAFYGSGRAIGIELKKLGDMLACIQSGRFSGHQLPGLCAQYDDVWLIVEGMWRPNPDDGVLEQWRGKWQPVQFGKRRHMYRELDAYLTTIEVKGGVRVKRSSSEQETARLVYGLYQWWQDYDGHKAHLALNRAGRDGAIFLKPTFVRRVAAELPGIGFEKSADIANAFANVRSMVDASEKDWTQVRGVGKKLAKQIVEAWNSHA